MDFKIARSNRQCGICGRRFENREKYFVGLISRAREDGAFDRADMCRQCWERQGAGNLAAWWPSEFSIDKKPVLLDPDLLWQVFHRARGPEESEPKLEPLERQRFAYVAALGLLRLKQLRLKATKRTKLGELLVFETPAKRVKDKQVYEVPNPELDEKGVEAIQDRLSELA